MGINYNLYLDWWWSAEIFPVEYGRILKGNGLGKLLKISPRPYRHEYQRFVNGQFPTFSRLRMTRGRLARLTNFRWSILNLDSKYFYHMLLHTLIPSSRTKFDPRGFWSTRGKILEENFPSRIPFHESFPFLEIDIFLISWIIKKFTLAFIINKNMTRGLTEWVGLFMGWPKRLTFLWVAEWVDHFLDWPNGLNIFLKGGPTNINN